MATVGERITDLIGSDYSVIPANSKADLINAAINEVADLLPSELLLKYAVDPINLTNSDPASSAVKGKKILLVTRLDGSGGYNRECMPVSIEDFQKAKDSNSIYHATKFSPVYSYETDAGSTTLTVYPTPITNEEGKIYYYAYLDSDQSGSTTPTGFPDEAVQAIVLKSSINILQAYISDFVQDEEDQEMQSMINGQIQSLGALYTVEINRFREPDGTPRGE
jgi:hypothetical protein